MATCEPCSGAWRTIRDAPLRRDHPPGAVNVAPAGVARWVSAARCSAADICGACGEGKATCADRKTMAEKRKSLARQVVGLEEQTGFMVPNYNDERCPRGRIIWPAEQRSRNQA